MDNRLTKEVALELVAEIVSVKGDYEKAHSKEDALRNWYIESCANGLYTRKEMKEIGQLVLSTNDIAFPRYCS